VEAARRAVLEAAAARRREEADGDDEDVVIGAAPGLILTLACGPANRRGQMRWVCRSERVWGRRR
jgi:hypothetical protein